MKQKILKTSGALLIAGSAFTAEIPAPEWTKDLVICEIATKGYTSPAGPESGTFNSLKEKIPHLKATGINGIWLTGHSLSDPKHFYNIWTQYACINPFEIDPSLGTPEDFKALIAECHQNGIRVFLDVITHGVMKNSPLIKEHPTWFKGESWGMADYNWGGHVAELDRWWVDGWVETVRKFGVDGFRLDLGGFRYDLWKEIRRRCAEEGHPIVTFPEGHAAIADATNFSQQYLRVSKSHKGFAPSAAVSDLPSLIRQAYGPPLPSFSVELVYADGTHVHAGKGSGRLPLKILSDRTDVVGRLQSEPDGIPDYHLRVQDAPAGKMPVAANLQGGSNLQWRWPADGVHWAAKVTAAGSNTVEIAVSTLDANRPREYYGSIVLSCHDNGWQGQALKSNPYIAQGSWAIFGYAAAFAPAIPIFMAGEEFDSDYRPLPDLSPNLYGGKNPGKGRWLYGGWLDWSQLDQPRQAAMLKDVTRMLAIRREYADVLGAELIAEMPRLAPVAVEGDATLPVPYIRWTDRRAVLVAANPGTQAVTVTFLLDPRVCGWDSRGLRLTDLWGGAETRTVPVNTNGLARMTISIPPDKAPGGGLAVYLIQRNPVKEEE